mgnify:CR=1 FL=1
MHHSCRNHESSSSQFDKTYLNFCAKMDKNESFSYYQIRKYIYSFKTAAYCHLA